MQSLKDFWLSPDKDSATHLDIEFHQGQERSRKLSLFASTKFYIYSFANGLDWLCPTLDCKCLTKRVDIFPAPTMAIRESEKSWDGSFSWQSSAAAELTETAPLEMDVSERTRFPAVIAYSYTVKTSESRWRLYINTVNFPLVAIRAFKHSSIN